MDRIIEEISKAVSEQLKDKERASLVYTVDGVKVKAIGISTGLITPYKVAQINGIDQHSDPFYEPWAKALSRWAAEQFCGPAISGVHLVRDMAPLCKFDDIPSTGCRFNCGPILELNTNIGTLTAPPCHGVDSPACAGKVMFPDLCTAVKAGGCKPLDPNSNFYLYSVSMLDLTNREYEIYEVKLTVDDLPLALYSFSAVPERKMYDEILYLYMSIAFFFDYRVTNTGQGGGPNQPG
jgi:hypothetical protein